MQALNEDVPADDTLSLWFQFVSPSRSSIYEIPETLTVELSIQMHLP